MASVIPPTTRGGADGDFDISYDGTRSRSSDAAALDPADIDDDDSAYSCATCSARPDRQGLAAQAAARRRDLGRRDTGRIHRRPRLDGDVHADLRGAGGHGQRDGPDAAAVELRRRVPGRIRRADASCSGRPTAVAWWPGDTDSENDFYISTWVAASLFRVSPTTPAGSAAGDFDPGDATAFNASDPALPGTDGARPQVFTYDDGGSTILLSLPDGETRRGETVRHVGRPAPCGLGERALRRDVDRESRRSAPRARRPARFWIGQIIVRDVAGGVTTSVSAGHGRRARRPLRGRRRRSTHSAIASHSGRAQGTSSGGLGRPTCTSTCVTSRRARCSAIDRTATAARPRTVRMTRSFRRTARRSCSSPTARTCRTRPGATTRTWRTWPRARSRSSTGRRTGRSRTATCATSTSRPTARAWRSSRMRRTSEASRLPAPRLRQGRRVRRADLRVATGERHANRLRARAHVQRRRKPRWVDRRHRRASGTGRTACSTSSCATSQPARRRSRRSAARRARGERAAGRARPDRHAPGVPAAVRRRHPAGRAAA